MKPLFRSKSLLEHASFSFEATERCFELYFVRLEHASFSVDTTERCFELYFVRLHRRRKAPYADLVYIYIATILSARYPDITFTTVKRENGVAIDWALLVHVSVASGSRLSSLTWSTALAEQKGVNTADIDKQYLDHFAPRDAPPTGSQ